MMSEHPSSHFQTTMVLQLLSVRRSLIDIEPIRRRHHAVRPMEREVTTAAGDTHIKDPPNYSQDRDWLIKIVDLSS